MSVCLSVGPSICLLLLLLSLSLSVCLSVSLFVFLHKRNSKRVSLFVPMAYIYADLKTKFTPDCSIRSLKTATEARNQPLSECVNFFFFMPQTKENNFLIVRAAIKDITDVQKWVFLSVCDCRSPPPLLASLHRPCPLFLCFACLTICPPHPPSLSQPLSFV